jgi:hypothetical protein
MGETIISELQPPKGLLFISQMIREYGEPWWNDIDSKTEELGEQPVPMPLWPPQIPQGLTRVQTQVSQAGD